MADGRSALSVVVPTRDRPAMLAACLKTLGRAVRAGDEIIVVDSASRDPEVRGVAEQHGVRYVRSDVPGASLARNIGWRAAVHDLIAFVDDDVRVDAGWADAVVAAFDTRPAVAFVTGRLGVPEGQEDAIRPVAVTDGDVAIESRGAHDLPGHSASVAVRRDALAAIGGFDERLGAGGEFRAAEDGDLFDRLYAQGLVGRYEPAAAAWHEQWRSRRQLMSMDYAYGFGSGARVAKLLRTDRIRALKFAKTQYWGSGVRDVYVNLVHKRAPFLALIAAGRFLGSVFGLLRAAPIPVRAGHFVLRGRSPESSAPPSIPGPRARTRVALDVTPAVLGIAGIGRYSRNLWERLRTRDDVSLRVFAAGKGSDRAGLDVLRLRLPLRALYPIWRTAHWPRAETLVGDVDVVHCLDMLPPPTRKPLVMTWHDTFRYGSAEYHDPRMLRLQEMRVEAVRRSAAVVLTLCEATAQEVVENIGIPRDRIVVAGVGCELPEVIDAPRPVPGPFILGAGALTPRKGFDVLARAVARLGPDAPTLVIAGPDGWNADLVRRQLFAELPSERCVLLGERYADIAALYRQAVVVCHPSLAEGFGMVCLEAMAGGAAVVAADIPSVREFTDGGVVLVPAGDADAMAASIAALLSDDARRTSLGEAARRRASTFTWDKTVDAVVGAYQLAARP